LIYVGIDDTDTAESRGTGKLARSIAQELAHKYPVFGVTRHQLFVHPDIPFTSHNSCAVIHVQAPQSALNEIFEKVKKLMLADFIEGSDPGLAIAETAQVSAAAVAFGQDTKTLIVTQQRAFNVACNCGFHVEGLGGTNGGIIGAVAGIGLASLQNDGRFLLKGRNRELTGVRSVAEVLGEGIDQILTLQGRKVTEGKIKIPKNATPSFIHGKAVLFVEPAEDSYVALKRA
jgi:tRNA(Ile2) C34 agmatinyltransferase TiaS